MVPVHVIGGFLGAGKTTAVIALLERLRGERVAVLVNDFGTARIDDDVIGATGLAQVAEIHGACVCCTAPEGLTHDLRKLLDEVRPDRVLIEPTGLGRPQDVVDTLRRGPLRERITVGPVVVVVDGSALARVRGEALVREQVEAADVVVLSHADALSEEDRLEARAWLGTFWPGPERIVEAVRGDVPPDVLLAPVTAPNPTRPTSSVSTDGYIGRSALFGDLLFHRGRLLAAIGALPYAITRVKGLFRTAEGTFLVERAGGVVHDRPTGRRADSRVDVIGREGVDDAVAAIRACEATDAERALAKDAVELVLDGATQRFDRAALDALDGVPDVGAVVPKRRGKAAHVAALWAKAGVPDDAEVVFVAHDGLATPPVPASEPKPGLLAYALGDGPLPDADGGPVRLLVPGATSACANVKGVARIVVRRVT